MKINGKKVVNGKSDFRLKIQQRDITRGKSKAPAECAAALALMRENKDISSVRVHIGRIFIETPGAWLRYKTPHTLRDEIVAFDRGGQFLPGEHMVKALTPSEQRYIDDKEWRELKTRHRNEKPRHERTKRISHIVPGVRPRGANK